MRLVEMACNADEHPVLVYAQKIIDGGERPAEGADEEGGFLPGVQVSPCPSDALHSFFLQMIC